MLCPRNNKTGTHPHRLAQAQAKLNILTITDILFGRPCRRLYWYTYDDSKGRHNEPQ